MRPAAQHPEHAYSVGPVRGLSQILPVDPDDGVGADDNCVRERLPYGLRLSFRQSRYTLDEIAGRFASFVDAALPHFKRQSDLAEKALAAGGPGGEYELLLDEHRPKEPSESKKERYTFIALDRHTRHHVFGII